MLVNQRPVVDDDGEVDKTVLDQFTETHVAEPFGVGRRSFQIEEHEDQFHLFRVVIGANDQLPKVPGSELAVDGLEETEEEADDGDVKEDDEAIDGKNPVGLGFQTLISKLG